MSDKFKTVTSDCAYLPPVEQRNHQPVELPIEAMTKAALDSHCQLLTDIFMHLPTEVIDDDRPRVAAGFIGAVVRTCVMAARNNAPKRESAQPDECRESFEEWYKQFGNGDAIGFKLKIKGIAEVAWDAAWEALCKR